MTRVCIITNELFPLAPGGIGRLVHNFVEDSADAGAPVELHVLVLAPEPTVTEAECVCDGLATIHGLTPQLLERLLSTASSAPRTAEGEFHAYFTSLAIWLWLAMKERQGLRFDFVEFPDIHAWGLHSITGKRARLGLLETTLVVRLHSTNGIISYFEPSYHHPSLQWLYTYDSERFCLATADLVVGHLDAIRDFNGQFYGFDPEWKNRTRVERPPVTLTESERTPERSAAGLPEALLAAMDQGKPVFVFSQRLQPFKRADLFLDAAVIACRRAARDDDAMYVVLSYGWDEGYIAGLKAKIPADLAKRILFLKGIPPETRAYVLHHSVCVFPSAYESLCLAAVECQQQGRPVILNGACIGFAENPWFSGAPGVRFFDGTASDLASTMTSMMHGHAGIRRRNWVHDRPYWEDAQAVNADAAPRTGQVPIAVVAWLGSSLPTDRLALESVHGARLDGLRVHTVETRPAHALGFWLSSVSKHDPTRLALHNLAGVGEIEAILSTLGDGGDEDYAMLVPSGLVPNPEFLRVAAGVLGGNVAGVTGPLMRYRQVADLVRDEPGELLPRLACSLAGSMLTVGPLVGGIYRRSALVRSLRQGLGHPDSLRDAHAAIVSAGEIVLELPVASARLVDTGAFGGQLSAPRRAGMLRALSGTTGYRGALVP
jgi:glycosyltransferase involved in cell wall biosynthesis